MNMKKIVKIADVQPKQKPNQKMTVDSPKDKVIKNPLKHFETALSKLLVGMEKDPFKQNMNLAQAIELVVGEVKKSFGQEVGDEFHSKIIRIRGIEPAILEDILIEAKKMQGDPSATDEANKRYDKMRKDLDGGFKFDQMKDQILDNQAFTPKLTPEQQKNRLIEVSKKQKLNQIKLSQAQWTQIGKKTGWLK